MISAALPDPPPRCSSPPRLHLRSSPPAPRPEPRRPRVINHAPPPPPVTQQEEEEVVAALAVKETVGGGSSEFPVPPPRHCRKRPARPPIPEEGGGVVARASTEEGAENEAAEKDEGVDVASPWERTRRNGGGAAPLGRRSLRASRDSLCPTVQTDQVQESTSDDDKADHWLLLPRRALAMDERQLRQDLAGLRFSMNLLDGQGAGSGNVWLCE